MKKIVIIGAGEIGVALGDLLAKLGHQVSWWDSASDKVPNQRPLVDIVPEAEFVFCCVPSWGVRQALVGIYPHLSKESIVLSVTKGVEKDTHKLINELLKELLPSDQPFALLSGPMLAEELNKDNYGFGVIASDRPEVGDKVRELFAGSRIKLSFSNDLRSVAIAGVLKNIYTFAIGFSDALGWGDNAHGWLAVQSMNEVEAIFSRLKLDRLVASGPAGLGDFIATSTSSGSRNKQAALEIIATGKITNQSEGAVSIESVIFLLGGDTGGLPLLRTLADIILDRADARTVFSQFIEDHGND